MIRGAGITKQFLISRSIHSMTITRQQQIRKGLVPCFSYSSHEINKAYYHNHPTPHPNAHQTIRSFGNNLERKEAAKKKIDYGKIATETFTTIKGFGSRAVLSTLDFFRHPSQIPSKMKTLWQAIKHEAHHYWVGSKLLWAEIKTTNEIVGRVLQGHLMTRRERLQLIRTTMDLLRLVPFSVFVIVPFMELLLPLAVKLFPNMLPSTFEVNPPPHPPTGLLTLSWFRIRSKKKKH
jgi:hypothetical protein